MGAGILKKENCFPVLTLDSEELHYTLKGGKDVQISKYYWENDPSRNKNATIRLNKNIFRLSSLISINSKT